MTLACVFAGFGFLSYRYFGHMENKFVIYNFPTDPFLRTTEMMFCINLVFSYPLTIFPTNKIIESFLFRCMPRVTFTRKWLKNLSRTVVCFLGCWFSILFRANLDDFLGVSGAVLGVSIILIMPTLCHYKLVAESRFDKTVDIIIICISFVILCLCTYNGLAAWIGESKWSIIWWGIDKFKI